MTEEKLQAFVDQRAKEKMGASLHEAATAIGWTKSDLDKALWQAMGRR